MGILISTIIKIRDKNPEGSKNRKK